ncbi:hypothetical protein F5051DRAFT_446798 [Lentinula edodes]|nr:hypothetical protein F5051DRAFT_446798 [Lentinula edodes]
MGFTIIVAPDNTERVLTRSRTALLANSSPLPPSTKPEQRVLSETDLAQGYYQVPLTNQHSQTPVTDSDSDSDSDYNNTFNSFTMPPVFSSSLNDTVTYAKWKPSGNGMPGSMSCGKITVETLELAKRDLRIFLTNNRKLAPSDYTVRCLNVWEDPRVSNWIDQNREKFTLLSFAEFFIVDLKTSVSDLAVQLLVLNNLLQGTPRFQSEENLKIMLIDAVDSNLRESYNKEVEDHSANVSHGIHSKDFHTFTKAFQVLDNGRHRQLLLARQMAEHMIRSRPNSRPNTPAATSSTANAQAR